MTSTQCSLDVLSDDLKKLRFVVPGEAVGKEPIHQRKHQTMKNL